MIKAICYIQIILLALTVSNTYSQKTDSLKNLLTKSTSLEKRLPILLSLCSEYQYINSDTAAYYIHQAISLNNNFNLKKYNSRIQGSYADILVLQDSIGKALDIYNSVKTDFLKEGELKYLTKVFLVAGNIYLMSEDYPNALSDYNCGLTLADSLSLNDLIPHFYNNIGSIYYNIGSDKKAYDNYLKAARFFKLNADTFNLAIAYANISNIYINSEQEDLALESLNMATRLFERTQNYFRLSESYISYSKLYLKKGELKKAYESIQMAIEVIGKEGDSYMGPKTLAHSSIQLVLGQVLLEMDSLQQSEKALLKCFDLSKENNFYNNSSLAARSLSSLYKTLGKWQTAFKYLETSIEYSNLSQNDEKLNKLAKKELDYAIEKQKRKQQIMLLEQKNEQVRNYWLLATGVLSFVLISIILFLLYWLEKNKRLRALESEKAIHKDLDYRNKELATFVLYLMKKNELVLETSKKLKRMKLTSESNTKILMEIISSLDTDPVTDLGEEFDMRFKEVHTGFYKNLSKDFPGLTTNELRLCAFLRLNMNTKDISAITFQSTNSIAVARHRLRNKFGLQSNDSLAGFLSRY